MFNYSSTCETSISGHDRKQFFLRRILQARLRVFHITYRITLTRDDKNRSNRALHRLGDGRP